MRPGDLETQDQSQRISPPRIASPANSTVLALRHALLLPGLDRRRLRRTTREHPRLRASRSGKDSHAVGNRSGADCGLRLSGLVQHNDTSCGKAAGRPNAISNSSRYSRSSIASTRFRSTASATYSKTGRRWMYCSPSCPNATSRSLMIRLNLVFSEWDRIFKDPMTG